ncbi:MAG: MATE family efflux transporter [Clostridiales bacterium]|nr:MATE family efflux transporter [Clostridiales bacterium]
MDHTKQLGEEKISKLLLSYTLPAIAGSIVTSIYSVIDSVFIGNGTDSLGLAGISICFPLMMIAGAFSVLIGMGAMSLFSILLGQQKGDEAERIVSNTFGLLIILPGIFMTFILIFMKPILMAIGADANLLPYAMSYAIPVISGSIFQSIAMGMNNFIRAEGNPNRSMATFIIGAVVNCVLAALFIFVFKWGMFGAGLATCLAQLSTCIWVMIYYITGKSRFKLRFKHMIPDLRITLESLAIGIAPFSMMLAASFLSVIMNKSLFLYGGNLAISAMSVVNSLMNLILMPVMGINMGAQPIIGYNYGAEKYKRVKETLKLAAIYATAITVFGFILTRVIPSQLVSIYNGRDQELIAMGTKALGIYLIMLPIVGIQMVGSNYFQAVKKPVASMILTLSRQVLILVPMIIILPKIFGLTGIFIAGPVADFSSSAITVVWLSFEIKRLNRLADKKDTEALDAGTYILPGEELFARDTVLAAEAMEEANA